jgi:hypothetical protein
MPDREIVFCMIAPSAEAVVITLRATGVIRAGAAFFVLDEGGTNMLETWRLSAGDTGSADHRIARNPASLNHCWVTWDIEVCSVLAGQDTGTVEVIISQHGVSCPITKPQRWDLSQLPQCSSGSTIPIRRGVQFHTL